MLALNLFGRASSWAVTVQSRCPPPVASAPPTRALVAGTVFGFGAMGGEPSTERGHFPLRVEIAAEPGGGAAVRKLHSPHWNDFTRAFSNILIS